VLNEIVADIRPPENLVLSNALPRIPITTSYYRWDILRNSRTIASVNVPNAEATLVDRMGRAQGAASLVYTREKKTFEPTTTMWLREVGTISNIQNAEQAVMREIQDLNLRVDNLVEWCCWQALQGSLSFPNSESVVVDPINYQIPASNFVHPSTSWATATPSQIVSDIEAWMRIVQRNARIPLTDAWLTSKTLQRIFNAFAVNAEAGGYLLTDTMRTAYFNSGMQTLPGFMGLTWHVVEGQYDANYDNAAIEGDFSLFLPDDKVIFTNLSVGDPMKIVEGPTADFDNSQGAIGKFMKTWTQEDPSARYALLESRFLPVITRPDQILIVPDVTATS